MTMPSAITFAVGDKDYITKLTQLIADINAMYAQYLTTLAPAYFVGTSNTNNVAIGNGSKSLVLAEASARAWVVGMSVRASNAASPGNYLEGQITAYSHPNITISATATGSGTPSSWTIGLANPSALITSATPGTATADQFIKVNSAGNAIVGATGPANAMTDEVAWFLMR